MRQFCYKRSVITKITGGKESEDKLVRKVSHYKDNWREGERGQKSPVVMPGHSTRLTTSSPILSLPIIQILITGHLSTVD
ncbi:hypothetical protein E2C01_020530 [Portunus trituberculatus]|uniref:Uncharacterized protein n=1 Tax=Portunus trituberculatus TaxID=210409 RepID=A0A5B7E008_PORTR|nr:hypothetical protein [Portunus trituberculatus]